MRTWGWATLAHWSAADRCFFIENRLCAACRRKGVKTVEAACSQCSVTKRRGRPPGVKETRPREKRSLHRVPHKRDSNKVSVSGKSAVVDAAPENRPASKRARSSAHSPPPVQPRKVSKVEHNSHMLDNKSFKNELSPNIPISTNGASFSSDFSNAWSGACSSQTSYKMPSFAHFNHGASNIMGHQLGLGNFKNNSSSRVVSSTSSINTHQGHGAMDASCQQELLTAPAPHSVYQTGLNVNFIHHHSLQSNSGQSAMTAAHGQDDVMRGSNNGMNINNMSRLSQSVSHQSYSVSASSKQHDYQLQPSDRSGVSQHHFHDYAPASRHSHLQVQNPDQGYITCMLDDNNLFAAPAHNILSQMSEPLAQQDQAAQAFHVTALSNPQLNSQINGACGYQYNDESGGVSPWTKDATAMSTWSGQWGGGASRDVAPVWMVVVFLRSEV